MAALPRLPLEEEDLTAYAGRWVTRLEGRVIGQGGTPDQALRAAKSTRIKEVPELTYIPTTQPLVFSPLLKKVIDVLPDNRAIYLVGGAVRDALLGRATHDLDFALAEGALDIARHVADRLQAAYFPLDEERNTARLVIFDETGKRIRVDFASFRGSDLESDLQGRDFTVNAMAVDVRNPQALLDPIGGLDDLRTHKLRACTAAAFEDDPVRILRGLRLAAAYRFHILRETREHMRRAVPDLVRVSAERIRDELFHMLDGPTPAACIRAMDMLGILAYVLPELTDLKGLEQPDPHKYDVWEHTLNVVQQLEALLGALNPEYAPDAASNLILGLSVLRLGRYRQQIGQHLAVQLNADRPMKPLLILAALYHDAGKPRTCQVGEDGRIRFLGHEHVGADIVAERATKLRLSNDEIARLVAIVRHHMRPLLLTQNDRMPTRRAVYRFFRDVGPAGIDVCLLSLADFLGTAGASLDIDAWKSHLDVVRTLLEAYWEHPRDHITPPPIVGGKTLMKHFGLKPGPQVGLLLEAIREAQAAGEVSDLKEALAFARRFLEEPSGNDQG
jgi:putative nucleotidyltransferase with HDIG domain